MKPHPLVALDVHYDDDHDVACAAAVWFDDWDSPTSAGHQLHFVEGLAPYVPGSFYQRELPCLEPLVAALMDQLTPAALIVDAHVDVAHGRPGLGRHLFRALFERIRVIGVAKRSFRDGLGLPVERGESHQPLWVTATSDPAEAASGVKRMAGDHRIPTLLKEVDKRARAGIGCT